ncbi:UDP-2,3-diacylglucosamine diphosphatase [Halopseudomonas nanhaiensis]|uniref:UDP-2,3-diacylglucosamine diphosphatase n=1 Tax=Halopseudomonas nanhaiensis TaxID=2830842 RepID=UPI001CBC8FD7|nr:UDP-2,3-diacylglucosamine diphosphatase [Halopseudomonas nanhaiensis]UAW99855.1 UDP-2,3-diacylglucosamine diphosphatase [Halopseudomonas nanhaiensis]
MRYLFLSDLHLEAERPDITRAFLRCLDERAPACAAVYILGDFFEAWLGDDDPNPLGDQVAAALARLADTGVEIYFMHGNRDFLLGKGFCNKARATLLPDPSRVTLNGEPVLLMHGDSLCVDDVAYMKMRRWLRNPVSVAVLNALPLSTRHRIGRKLRSESQTRTRMKASDITDVNQQAVEAVMRRHGVRTLIHGHTHRPAVHELQIEGKAAQRIVLGDWDRQGWVLEVDQDGYRLESFELNGNGT